MSPEANPQSDVARVAVKAPHVNNLGDASRVTKSFALKFLRKAFIAARIQRVEMPEGTRIPPEAEGLGPIETWQVWAYSDGKREGVIEVTAPVGVLPYAVVREAYRCRLNMAVRVENIKGGVRLSAEPIEPVPFVPGMTPEEMAKVREEQRDESVGYVSPLPPVGP